MKTDKKNLSWIAPPICAGQIVEVAYALDLDRERLWRRRTDRSDGSVSLEWVSYCDIPEDAFEALDPVNEEPQIDGALWQEVEVARG